MIEEDAALRRLVFDWMMATMRPFRNKPINNRLIENAFYAVNVGLHNLNKRVPIFSVMPELLIQVKPSKIYPDQLDIVAGNSWTIDLFSRYNADFVKRALGDDTQRGRTTSSGPLQAYPDR